MHELSLVQGLLGQLQTLAQQHRATSISRVRVEVGPFAGLVIDSFQFAFDILAQESELMKDAALEIIVPPRQYKCFQCKEVLISDQKMPESCPQCGAAMLVPEGGDGLILLRVEME